MLVLEFRNNLMLVSKITIMWFFVKTVQ